MSAQRLIGEVTYFTDFRGFGFIRAGATEYFVHISAIHQAEHNQIEQGDKVEFTPKHGNKGYYAIDVRKVSMGRSADDEVEPWIIMKRNPFTPQDPVTDPSKFAGRKEHFYNAVDALYNAKNILISGPRGIGKSSIANQLLLLARGENALAERFGIDLSGETFDRITGDFRCSPGSTLSEIAASLLATLQIGVGKIYKSTGVKEDFSVDLKYFKLGSSETFAEVSTGELATMFAIDVERVFKHVDQKARGITFLIDEIDVLLDEVELAPFLKAVTERLRMTYHLNVSFLLSGVTGSATNLILQHASAARLFENLVLGPMTAKELGEVIDLCLKDTGVEITEHARNMVISLANNFPQPVHLIGYHAFRLDGDAKIDVGDIERAREFIVTTLKNQEFRERFHKLIQGGALDVTRAFAISKHETVNMAYVRRMVPDYDDSAIGRAVKELQVHEIIEKQGSEYWRFRDPLFKVYLRIALGMDEKDASLERGQVGFRTKTRSRRPVDSKRPNSTSGRSRTGRPDHP